MRAAESPTLVYLDTSVALAHLLAEDRRPPAGLWQEELVTSRLLEYEVCLAEAALAEGFDCRVARFGEGNGEFGLCGTDAKEEVEFVDSVHI